MSKQKVKGTKAETAHVRWLSSKGVDGVDRIALHGNEDKGDVGPIPARGLVGVAEVKNYKGKPTQGQLRKWQAETDAERDNGGWGFAYLVVHEPGCNIEDHNSPTYELNRAYVKLGDLMALAFGQGFEPTSERASLVYDTWVQLNLGKLAEIMFG